MIVLIAIATMIAATLAQHLGLAEAMARVVDKVASCPQCFTFWTTMTALLYLGYDVYVSALAAIVAAYLSNWFVLLLLIVQRKFTQLYEKKDTPPTASTIEAKAEIKPEVKTFFPILHVSAQKTLLVPHFRGICPTC